MKPETLTYTFHPKVPFRQVVHTLLLSAIGAAAAAPTASRPAQAQNATAPWRRSP